MDKTNFNPSYIEPRLDIEQLIFPDAKVVLDVGCSTGAVGTSIKEKWDAQVIGIELSPEMAREAALHLDRVFVGDVMEIIQQGKLDGYRFDTIIFGDVLEHLADPWTVLGAVVKYLAPEGVVIASIPNVRHIDTIYNLLIKGYWPNRDRGIHDRTHLRFFTKRNMIELFESAGLLVDTIAPNYRLIENGHRIDRFARFLAVPGIRDFLAFQYRIRGRLPKHSA